MYEGDFQKCQRDLGAQIQLKVIGACAPKSLNSIDFFDGACVPKTHRHF